MPTSTTERVPSRSRNVSTLRADSSPWLAPVIPYSPDWGRNLHDPPCRAIIRRTLPSHGKRRLFRAYGGREAESGASRMPSLIRFLTIVGIIAGLGLAGMWALANLIEP